MKAFIIEDEPLAMERFKTMLHEVDPTAEVIGEADSVKSALAWLRLNKPDVIFTDIQLADGECFRIFDKYIPACPVIFITAYNDHALEAFRVNAIDYLLKPLKKDELTKAWDKIRQRSVPVDFAVDYTRLAQTVIAEQNKYNRRYLIRFGEQIRTLNSDDIAYIYTTQKAVFAVIFSGKEYPMDKSLDALEKELDPSKFFRINRQFIINVKAVGSMHVASKSRVQLELNPPFREDEVIVSTEKSPLFKDWLGHE